MERQRRNKPGILRGSKILAAKERRVAEHDKWKPEYIKMVYEICLLGANNAELAGIFGVTTTTLENWRKRFPEFEVSMLKGKDLADAKVAKALYKRATGYSHPDTHIVKRSDDTIIITPIIKYYPPDTAAVKFWLTNRQPDKWRDMSKTDINSQHLHLHQGVPLQDISTEELEIMEKVGMKKLMSDPKRKN